MNAKDIIIWNNIEVLRKQKNLTYVELAKKAGIKPQIGNKLLNAFAVALGVNDTAGILFSFQQTEEKL